MAKNPNTALENAINKGCIDQVVALLSKGSSVNDKLSNGETLLVRALSLNHWDLASKLLELGAQADGKVNSYCTCLSWASLSDQTALAHAMLWRVTKLEESDYNGYTPLAWAVKLSDEAAVKRLLARGANVAVKDKAGNTLLHLAALQSNPHIISLLITACPKLNLIVNTEAKQNALHVAAAQANSDHGQIIKALLDAGVNFNQKDASGNTPAILAAASNSVSILNLLTNAGATLSPTDKIQALHLAITQDHEKQALRLIWSLDPTLALNASHPLRTAIALKRWSLIGSFFKAGLNPDSYLSPEKQALLPWAMEHLCPELAKILLIAGATTHRSQAIKWLNNLALLRKVGKINVHGGAFQPPQPANGPLLLALQKNIESLGFVLTPELAERVLALSIDELRAFYHTLIPCLRSMVGAHVSYKPMYPNFPDQVKELSDFELYFNALRHYWGDLIGRRILPHYIKFARPALTEKLPPQSIGLAAPDEADRILQTLLQAKGALTPADKDLVAWLVFVQGDNVGVRLPQEVPFRENAAILAAALLLFTSLHDRASSYLKTGVDALRVAAAYSGGDVSLASPTRFTSFPKPVRRWLLASLETDPNLDESLWRHPEKFKRLGERLHPGEFKKLFPKTWAAFQALRSTTKPPTYPNQIEGYLAQNDIQACLPLLKTRPGDFARRLDHLLRLSCPDQALSVLAAFHQVVDQIPSRLLLQLRTHFQSRDIPTHLRVIFPKGEIGKLQALTATRPALSPKVCTEIDAICQQALLTKFAIRPPLGICWVDKALKRYTVPFALRSAAKALHTVSRGSRINFPSPPQTTTHPREAMRFFIWWRDGQKRTDLDLSALVLTTDFTYDTTLSYYNLKELGGYHSGDITSAPHGASEFIDIEIPAFLARGSRYIMMVVNSYTAQAYCDLPECFAGFMYRSQPQSGEVYDPSTLLNKFDLTANTTIAIPLILDLEQRQVIWTDLSLKRNLSHVNNVHGNRSSLSLLCEAMVTLKRPNLYDLFDLHVQARGRYVQGTEEVQTAFSAEPFEGAITPYDIDQIMADYL